MADQEQGADDQRHDPKSPQYKQHQTRIRSTKRVDTALFVIVGAGASHDAASSWPSSDVRPPLVKDLFHPWHQAILAKYPLAQSAAPEIRDALEASTDPAPPSLEQFVRQTYRDSKDPYDRRRFYSISLYLQDLLWQATSARTVHFDNTDRLVGSLVRRFHHTCFITLNYDLILDQALEKLDRIATMNDYVGYRRWSLLKLHGSVNWGYRVLDGFAAEDPPADLDQHLGEEIELGRQGLDLSPTRNRPPRMGGRGELDDNFELFPALTVPVGEDDEETCPPRHLEFLDQRLQAENELDVLILGYSAYDRTVLEHIARSERRIRSLTIVNKDRESAQQVARRLFDVIPQSLSGTQVNLAPQSFGPWCKDSLPAFVVNSPAAIG